MAAAEPMGESDRISALPIDIKISILSLLDLKDVIRTSALARSWRPIWTLLPCLHLTEDLLGYRNEGITSDWMELAHHLVSSLRGPPVLFEFSQTFLSDQAPFVQRLLDLLLQKGGVEKLYLEFVCRPQLVNLPPFPSLKVLQLCHCHVLLPSGFQGFRSLATLELDHVQISNDHLNFLIHTSNKITTFLCSGFVTTQLPLSVNISLPLLTHLTFEIDDSIEKVLLTSAPLCLEQVDITTSNHIYATPKKFAPVALGLLISVATVSSLHFDTGILKCLSLVTLPYNFTFPRLRSVLFSFVVDTMDKTMYDAFFCLLRSMPFVEELNLMCSYQINRVEILKEELLGKKRDGFSCLNQTLKSVKINMGNAMIGVILGKFFLLNAKVLKLMKFYYWKRFYTEPGMIEELQKAKITSSNAKVVILCCREGGTINIK
ncbi:F-box/RNI-like/FBD-like domains-containing protein [Rhynchospora pubera]|uniref:F-box/RNI-like/FBD-like domains-containing protein n=1 Tax=Rhynchospora pubera TaxID=906938 RepID=A0AAV8E2A0_9POAL|nr:F-box/RNI-like/FBD-like domains-containing protein [Rhynchospora pubera]